MTKVSKEIWINIDKNGVLTRKDEAGENLTKPNVIMEEMIPEDLTEKHSI